MNEDKLVWEGAQEATLLVPKSTSVIKIDGVAPIYIYTKIKYNWFRAMMYKICFGLEFKKIEEDEKCY